MEVSGQIHHLAALTQKANFQNLSSKKFKWPQSHLEYGMKGEIAIHPLRIKYMLTSQHA
jgi:hypothetical protein